ncbi:hypothetical protein XENTR_v10015011 [Xenopus tropicalis]|nr:hypothetical protein XENTR_v10015011 [Xenopus tropicalis]
MSKACRPSTGTGHRLRHHSATGFAYQRGLLSAAIGLALISGYTSLGWTDRADCVAIHVNTRPHPVPGS